MYDTTYMYQNVGLFATAVCQTILKILSSHIAPSQDSLITGIVSTMAEVQWRSSASECCQHGPRKRIRHLIQAFRKSLYSRVETLRLRIFSQDPVRCDADDARPPMGKLILWACNIEAAG